MSQRLALEISTPEYLLTTESPLQLIYQMHQQVANHMRVCVAVGEGMESLHAIASSEPILSEAASRIMQIVPSFCLAEALRIILSHFCLDQGNRGELLVASFFTWARDQVIKKPNPVEHPGQLCRYFTVNELFEQLFSKLAFQTISDAMPSLYHSEAARQPFNKTFHKAKMHFNHFIKPQEQEVLNSKYLALYLARGAAALGTNCQTGFDAVYPYLYDDSTVLDHKKIGFIIVQVKNDSDPNHLDPNALFPLMDPIKHGLISKSDIEDGVFPIPIIRLIFSLIPNSETNDSGPLKVHTLPPPEDTTVKIGEDGQYRGRYNFTSYDFVCSGVSKDTLQPVEELPDLWASLANKPNPWSALYAVPEAEVLRSQFPGCGSNEDHWKNWAEGPLDI
jgi:hypothetical protein